MSELVLLSTLLLLITTIFLPLLERKILTFAQRRMGPTLLGRNGALHLAADIIKLLIKEAFLIPRSSNFLAPIFLSLMLTTQLLFALNIAWGPSMLLIDGVDSMILYHLTLILLSNIFLTLVGLVSQSRYTTIAMVRGLVHVISLDIFVTVVYSLLVLTSQSTNFHDFVILQSTIWYFFMYAPASSGFLIILFLESKRAPFDHSETEAEVVAGYAIEYSGPLVAVFLIAEYIHLLVASIHFIIFFLGG